MSCAANSRVSSTTLGCEREYSVVEPDRRCTRACPESACVSLWIVFLDLADPCSSTDRDVVPRAPDPCSVDDPGASSALPSMDGFDFRGSRFDPRLVLDSSMGLRRVRARSAVPDPVSRSLGGVLRACRGAIGAPIRVPLGDARRRVGRGRVRPIRIPLRVSLVSERSPAYRERDAVSAGGDRRIPARDAVCGVRQLRHHHAHGLRSSGERIARDHCRHCRLGVHGIRRDRVGDGG